MAPLAYLRNRLENAPKRSRRADLLEMGFECFETCRAQGCEGLPPFKVGCFYICDAWHAECPKAAADLRSRWRREAKVVRMRG